MALASEVRNCLCLHTRRTARQLTQFYDAALRPSGLRVTQFTLLAAIGDMDPTTQQSLANFMGMDRTTLTRNLSLLERDGLVAIGEGKTDRRENRIRLTSGGRTAIAAAMPHWHRAQNEMLQRLHKAGDVSRAADVRATLDRLAAMTEQPGEGTAQNL